jgi:clan AA aspartic protease (TIGR02281 family)
MSIVSEKSAQLSGLSILSEQQNFYHIFLPDSMNEPGVLIQDQKIAGWAFGDLIPGGYLWKGPDESNLVYELSVFDYYRLTFENSREEQFIIGYSQKEMNPADQLEAFANGFRQDPVLAEKNTPDYLKSESVVAKMRSIIAQIVDGEGYHDMASILDSKVLTATGDVSFLIDVLTFGSQVNGPEYSIRVIEQVLEDPSVFNESQRHEIQVFQKELYQKWLTVLMNEKDYPGGMEAYRQAADSFDDDPEIHLLGVKLALVFYDWQTAEKILYSHSFPINLTDQVRVLEKQITELKFQENKIVVRFSPGSDQIPVSGILNNRLSQDFIVDTGASMVTIPTAAAKKLGIAVNAASPLRKLITAGGVIEAPEVILHSIQLDGWTEYNVTAYIVDMPNQSGLGLLGLNYLKRFRMDLNTESGILTLAPR